MTDVNASISDFHSSFYPKWLQEPFTATAGWIFKSLEHTDLVTFQQFLEQELSENHNFGGPIAIYRKVPFTGKASNPAKQDGEPTRYLGRAIHIDTLEYLSTTLWQKLNRLLKSTAMKKIHNFEWKFIPQFHSRRNLEDQNSLKEAAAKQKLVHRAISTITSEYFLDIDSPVTGQQGSTLRRFFLDQRLGDSGPQFILAIDWTENGDGHIFTSAKEHQEALSNLVQFSPICLLKSFGPDIRRKLTIVGIDALEDQYWDEEQNIPRSRFSDCLKEDQLDDRDIRIVFDNLPTDSLLPAGTKRPGETAGLDLDEITQTSFNTQGHSKAKVPRFEAPTNNANPEISDYVQRLESERAQQNEKIDKLEATLSRLLSLLPDQGPTIAAPTAWSDTSP